MKLSRRLLPLGCALVMVCLFAVKSEAGQSSGAVPNRVTRKPDENVRVTLAGNVHPRARAAYSRGAVADSLRMDRILLLLKRSEDQETALQALVEAQQDKSSPNYHGWLTPDEFGKQFGPSDADLQAVTDWLSAQGFEKVRVSAGRTVIEFNANAGQVRQAFALTGVEAVMLARGALGNPWLFAQLVHGRERAPTPDEVVAELDWLIDRAVEHLGEVRATRFLRKFYPWYVGRLGLPAASLRRLKEELQTAATLAHARALLERTGRPAALVA